MPAVCIALKYVFKGIVILRAVFLLLMNLKNPPPLAGVSGTR
jgi:hypothetical protein